MDRLTEIRLWHADVDMRFDDKPSRAHQDREVLLSEIDKLQAEVERLRKAHEAACGGDELLRAAFTRLLDRLTRDRDEARAENERMRALLKDPNAVTINMLRGVIALPSADQMRHIYQQTLEAKP